MFPQSTFTLRALRKKRATASLNPMKMKPTISLIFSDDVSDTSSKDYDELEGT